MIQKDDLVSNWIIFFADKEVSGMSVTVHESELKYHCCKYVNEVVSDFSRIDPILNHFLLLANFDSFCELHHYQSIWTQMGVVLRYVYFIIIFEQLFDPKSISNLDIEV